MFRSKEPSISVLIARGALDSIFDECDQCDSHETGGRLIGRYRKRGSDYEIEVLGVLGPGPNARRSATSFFQDGEYQEREFRAIEEKHPDIEHLGNWHTHHVNGLATLSQGDHATYHRIVNHDKHNTDFFYALLVVKKNPGRDPRYEVNHYFFRRNDESVDEIPRTHVRIVESPTVWPVAPEQPSAKASGRHSEEQILPSLERVKDQEFFSDFYPSMQGLFSKRMSALYWKGSLRLVDGSHAEVIALENPADTAPFYSITTGHQEARIAKIADEYKGRRFPSARHAVIHLERDLNQAIYRFNRG